MGRLYRLQAGSLFGSDQPRVKYVRVGYGYGLDEVRIRIYFESIMCGSGLGLVRLKPRSGLFQMARQ